MRRTCVVAASVAAQCADSLSSNDRYHEQRGNGIGPPPSGERVERVDHFAYFQPVSTICLFDFLNWSS